MAKIITLNLRDQQYRIAQTGRSDIEKVRQRLQSMRPNFLQEAAAAIATIENDALVDRLWKTALDRSAQRITDDEALAYLTTLEGMIWLVVAKLAEQGTVITEDEIFSAYEEATPAERKNMIVVEDEKLPSPPDTSPRRHRLPKKEK